VPRRSRKDNKTRRPDVLLLQKKYHCPEIIDKKSCRKLIRQL
jgi:hypothetical protein